MATYAQLYQELTSGSLAPYVPFFADDAKSRSVLPVSSKALAYAALATALLLAFTGLSLSGTAASEPSTATQTQSELLKTGYDTPESKSPSASGRSTPVPVSSTSPATASTSSGIEEISTVETYALALAFGALASLCAGVGIVAAFCAVGINV